METDRVIWRPSPEHLTDSNIARFMRKVGAASYADLQKKSVADIRWFWAQVDEDLGLMWDAPYAQILDDSRGIAWSKWFVGGRINIAKNCLERHCGTPVFGKAAVIAAREDGTASVLTYAELDARASQVANCLAQFGVRRGDAVGIYMPLVADIVAVLFGCFRAGAVAIPIFSGFGAPAVAARLRDGQAKAVFTANAAVRRGKEVPLKAILDEAIAEVPSVRHVVVYPRLPEPCPMSSRDRTWQDAVLAQSTIFETVIAGAEDPCLILYTSGTTGNPKGCVHTHAGALAQIGKELRYALDLRATDRVLWMTDIGWMMGPWEMIGVALHGATMVLFEGAPDYPAPDRLWKTIAAHRVSVLGMAPTGVRLLMRYGAKPLDGCDLSSLRILGSTGEPWDPGSYLWYFEHVGGARCPVINISGGTEIIGCLLFPTVVTPLKPCTLFGPAPGMDVDVFDDAGKPVRGGIGHLVCKQPAPSMTKGFLGDTQRYLDTYFSRWPGVWYHGDWAHVDADGFWFLHGRSDDTINIAAKRVGPAEFEAPLNAHSAVTEAAAIGVPSALKGEEAVCFVVLHPGRAPSEALRTELMDAVVQAMGKSFKPAAVRFVSALPKTRSAKILRGLIRRLYLGEEPGDLGSLENEESLDAIRSAS